MSDHTRTDGLADLINLVAAPIAGGLRAAEQVKRGVDELFRAVENLNRTMENLNDAAERVNRLLGDLEEPIRIMLPQLTRTIRVADDITQRLDPRQLAEFTSLVADLVKRLGPLAALAENAGGLFGGLRLPGAGLVPRPAAPASAPRPTAPTAPAAPATTSGDAPRRGADSGATKSGKAGDAPKPGKGDKTGKGGTSAKSAKSTGSGKSPKSGTSGRTGPAKGSKPKSGARSSGR